MSADDPRSPPRPARLASRELYRRAFLGVHEHTIALRSGGDRRVISLDLPDCCVVVAVTEDGRFVLVRQHRHGIDASTLEPAGGVVERGEDPAAAAPRELREETGYELASVEPLGWAHVNPPIASARVFFFLGRGARRTAEPVDDECEEVETVLLDEADVVAQLEGGQFTHVLAAHALTLAIARLGRERVASADRRAVERVLALLDGMEAHAHGKVVALARRLLPGLTAEDLRNPHDFPDLDDPDWHFEDGQLVGIQAVRFAIRSAARDLLGHGDQEEGTRAGAGETG